MGGLNLGKVVSLHPVRPIPRPHSLSQDGKALCASAYVDPAWPTPASTLRTQQPTVRGGNAVQRVRGGSMAVSL